MHGMLQCTWFSKSHIRQKRLINYKAKCYTFTVYPCDFHNSCMFFSPNENFMLLYNNYFFSMCSFSILSFFSYKSNKYCFKKMIEKSLLKIIYISFCTSKFSFLTNKKLTKMVQVKKKVWAPISSAFYASKNDSCFIAILPSRHVFFLILFSLKFRTLQLLRMSIVVLITDKPFQDLGKCELFWLYPSEYINLFSVNLF